MENTCECRGVITCVYCGKEYPKGTPPWGNKVLTDHIAVCRKHPLAKAKRDIAKLRRALLGMLSVKEKNLPIMADNIASINPRSAAAVKALLATSKNE